MNQFGFLSDDTFAEKMDTQNMFLAGLLSAHEGSIKPTSFKEVQTLVRAGLASKVFHIGDQLICNKGSTQLVWDIIGIDHDTPADRQYTHSMTLQLHDCYANIQFDAEEAFWYCEEELPAGTYYVVMGTSWGTHVVANKKYQFTLTQNVPVGGQLVGFLHAPDAAPTSWTVKSYENNTSTTAIETVTVTEGEGGTQLGTFTASVQGNLNSLHRAAYGSNNWVESAMKQWLNSDKVAGAVWTPKTKFDRPPSWVSNTAGWMNNMDADFLEVIGETEKVTSRNNVTDGGGFDTTVDKFFLLSRREVFAGNELSNVIEGEPYPYYSDYSDYANANAGEDKNRIKYLNGSPRYWWLRTPYSGSGSGVRHVGTTGSLSYSSASSSYGVAPACNII